MKKIIEADSVDLKSNQIIITPTFGSAETNQFLSENNPHFLHNASGPYAIGLESHADSIVQDRLPIVKISAQPKTSAPYFQQKFY